MRRFRLLLISIISFLIVSWGMLLNDELSSPVYNQAHATLPPQEVAQARVSDIPSVPKGSTSTSSQGTAAEGTFDGKFVTITKNGKSHTCKAITDSIAPTSPGTYCIREQGKEQRLGKIHRTEGFPYVSYSDRTVWYLLEPQFETTRYKINLHPGRTSKGCVTVTDGGCFKQLAEILNSPGTVQGYGYDGYPPGSNVKDSDGNFIIKEKKTVDCVGFLTVKETKPADSENLKEGKSYGDPHLITFDGYRYSFQTVGEFVLTKSNDGEFEVQVRQVPVNSSLSLNSAVAMQVGADRVAFYSQDFPDSDTENPLRIDGKSVVMQGERLFLPDGGTIAKNDSTYVVSFPTGEKVVVSLVNFGNKSYFNVLPYVINSSSEIYSGLLGNANGNSNDDLKIRGGKVLPSRSTYGNLEQVLNFVGVGQLPLSLDGAEKLYFDQIYKEFSNSWRLKQENSLFNYLPNKTTASYTDINFPDKYLKLEMLSSEQIQKARSACEAAKVTPDLMEGCIFDVGFTGFSEFAYTTSQINSYLNTINQLFPGVSVHKIEVQNDSLGIPKKVCLPFMGCVDRPF